MIGFINRFVNPWWLLAVLIMAAGTFGLGLKLGGDYQVAKQAREDEKLAKVAQEATNAAVAAIGEIRIENKTIQRNAETVIREVPVYRDCVHDPRVERMLNAAREGKPVESGDRTGLPETRPGQSPGLQ